MSEVARLTGRSDFVFTRGGGCRYMAGGHMLRQCAEFASRYTKNTTHLRGERASPGDLGYGECGCVFGR